MRINPELLSTKPTHRTTAGTLVKVFSDRYGPSYDFDGRRVATAEIMEGESVGKWTTVYFDELVSLSEHDEETT
jgi:hypothetical protein